MLGDLGETDTHAEVALVVHALSFATDCQRIQRIVSPVSTVVLEAELDRARARRPNI